MPKVGISLTGMATWFSGDASGVIELTRLADEKGIDQVSVSEHVIMGEDVNEYPYGKFPFDMNFPWHEPMTMLAAIAGATKTIGLTSTILIAPLRPAVLLAKQLATLDVISRGRVSIGLGVGWQSVEYHASGVPWERRFDILFEQAQVCKKLWSEAPASFDGATVKFDRLYSLPAPVQKDMPLSFGLPATAKNIDRIAKYGDGWCPIEADIGKLKVSVQRLRAAFDRHGRDPDVLRVSMNAPMKIGAEGKADLDATLAQMPLLADAGVTAVNFFPAIFCSGVGEYPAFLDKILQSKDL